MIEGSVFWGRFFGQVLLTVGFVGSSPLGVFGCFVECFKFMVFGSFVFGGF